MFGMFDFPSNEESLKNKQEINKKLNDKDNPPSLEDLLVLDGLVSEVRGRNKKLMEFFTKEKIKKMVDYIITEPKVDDYNTAHKFPFVCSKIFNLDIYDMMKYFLMTKNELIEEKNKKDLGLRAFDSEGMESIRSYEDEDFNDDIDFQGNNLNEFNMDDNNNNKNEKENNNNTNNDLIKEEIKENDEEKIKYKDSNDDMNNNNDNIDEQNNDDKFEDYNMNENKKDDEDDLVNHMDEEINDKIEKDEKNSANKIKNNQNEVEEEKKIEEHNDKKDNNQDDIIDNEKEKIMDEMSENLTKKIQEHKEEIEEKKEEKLNEDKVDKNNTDNNNNDKNEETKDDYPEDRIEILDYFLSFLLTDSELNYVLCGYFSSLISNLLSWKNGKIIHYIYEKRKDILDKLLYHSYNISISEILFRVLKFGENELDSDKDNNQLEVKHIAEIKSEVIKNLFDTIDINMNTEKLSCIFYNMKIFVSMPTIFKYLINNNYIINSLINKQLGKFNFANYEDDMNIFYKKNNCVIMCDILITWLNYIKQYDFQIPMLLYEVNEDSFEDTVQQNSSPVPELHHTILSQAFFDILPNFIKNNFNNENNPKETIIQSFNDEKLIPLGLYKIKIVELITNLIFYCRNIPNEIDDILIKSEFIPNLINYIFKYPYNNFYQDTVLQFFNMIFQKEEGRSYHEKLFDYIFSKLNFLAVIKEHFPKNIENEGNMGVGYTSFFVSLSYKINKIIGGTPINLDKNYTQEGILTFNTRGKSQKIGGISISYKITERNQKDDKGKKNDKIPLSVIPCLEKYCNDEWKYFFSEKIANKVKLYEEDLCDIKNQSNNNTAEKEDDLFYNPINENYNKEGENEQLLGFGNKRYYDNNNAFEDNNENKQNMANYKDMEININEFNLDEVINMDKNEEKENDEFNAVNYWKNDLEKEKNSYVNIIGEEAMKELMDE